MFLDTINNSNFEAVDERLPKGTLQSCLGNGPDLSFDSWKLDMSVDFNNAGHPAKKTGHGKTLLSVAGLFFPTYLFGVVDGYSPGTSSLSTQSVRPSVAPCDGTTVTGSA